MTEVTEVKTTKKAMISQPMSGKSREEILKERESAVSYLEGLGYEVVDTVFNFNAVSSKHLPVYYLSKAIERMSECDLIYFLEGWKNARGCAIEFNIANAYGINTMY